MLNHTAKRVRHFCSDSQGNLTFFQTPNTPLIAWAVFMVLSKITPTGELQQSFATISLLSLSAWAILEIFRGDSGFRKTLGIIFLTGILVSLFI